MRNLNNFELLSISGGALQVSEVTFGNILILKVKITDDSSYEFVKTENLSKVAAKVRLYSDHVETLGGELLFSGPGSFKHKGYNIGAVEIKGGMLYLLKSHY